MLAVTNIYPTPGHPAGGVFIQEQVDALRRRGLEVKVFLLDRRREGPWVYYRMTENLHGVVDEFAPNIVHVMYGGVMARQVAARPGLPPVVVTFHGSDLLGENLSGWKRKLISRYGVHCSRRAARLASGIVVVARHLLRSLGGGIAPEKIRLIPCGIDLARFKPLDQAECRAQLGWDMNDFHVIFASSAGDPVKRPALARAAVAALRRSPAKVRFHLLSGVPNTQVPLWLNAGNVLLLCSRHEGSPTIIKEALACGLPIVSVPVGDVPERIAGVEGCHLAEPTVADLAQKMERVRLASSRLHCGDRLQSLSGEAAAAELEDFYLDLRTANRSN